MPNLLARKRPDGSPARPVCDPFAHHPSADPVKTFDPSKEQNPGVVLGIAMSIYRKADGEDHFRVLPGEDVQLTFPTAGAPPTAVSDKFTIVDFYESKMLEYDSMFVFMPIKELQRLRGMFDRDGRGQRERHRDQVAARGPTATRFATS